MLFTNKEETLEEKDQVWLKRGRDKGKSGKRQRVKDKEKVREVNGKTVNAGDLSFSIL